MVDNFLRSLKRRFSAACRSQSGNVAILTGLAISAIVLAGGSAMDYSRASKVKAHLGSALDAAAISAAKDLSTGGWTLTQVKERAEAVFKANFRSQYMHEISVSGFDLTQNTVAKSVAVVANASLPTTFMAIANIEKLNVGNRAVARYSDKKLEMAMMLDVTGSMSGNKIKDLKDAAKDALDILLPAGASSSDVVRVGLVPYSYAVNAGSYASKVTNGASTKCVTERGSKYKFDDQQPVLSPLDKKSILGAATNRCPSATVIPITNDRNLLRSQINGLSADGYTAGHIGVAWAWYLLSPKWADIWPSASRPVAYNDEDTIKVVILMTDGEFNTAYESGNGSSTAQAKKLCKNMKKEGVIIYSVAFQAPWSAKKTLQNCATDSSHYFDASSGAELHAAFAEIAVNVRKLFLSE